MTDEIEYSSAMLDNIIRDAVDREYIRGYDYFGELDDFTNDYDYGSRATPRREAPSTKSTGANLRVRTSRARNAPVPPTILEHNGERLTIAQWADRIGIGRTALRDRLDKGWPLERALTEPKGASASSARAHVIRFDGLALTTREWADRLGISLNTLQARLCRTGWNVERSLSMPKGRHRQPLPAEISQR